MRARGGIAALALLLLPFRAAAIDLPGDPPGRLELTSTTTAAWHTDNDDSTACNDGYGDLRERLNLLASRGRWVVGARLDVDLYLSAPEEVMAMGDRPGCFAFDLENRYQQTFTPEKIWFGFASRDLEVVLGDAYVSFGRGLSLSLRKIDELGVDTTLQGAKVLWHRGRFAATLVAGHANPGNTDEATGRHEDDPWDLVGGVDAQVEVARGVNAGAHAVLYAFKEPTSGIPADDDYDERWLNVGPTLDAPRLLPNLGLFLEGLVQRRETETGYGFYGAATYYAGPATVLVEGKWYGDLATVQPDFDANEFNTVQYANLPTAERVLQPLEHPQREIRGARARVDYVHSPALVLHANYGLFHDDVGYLTRTDTGVETLDGTIHDPYAGFEARWDEARSRALVSLGWRLVFAGGDDVRGDGHLDFDVAQALGPSLSLELHGLHLERKKAEPLGEKEWREGTLQLGVRWTGRLAVAAVYDYTTEPLQPKEHYFAGTLQWDITPSSSVRLWAGASRGGLKCVSGVCRVFPPFEGVKLAVTLRF